MHVVADFNGDTHPDVITASESNTPVHSISLRLLTNDGTGTLTLVPGFSLPFEGTFTAVDIDRDGDQDLAIIIGDDLILRRNDGQANFGAAETIIAGMAGWPAFGDFNGDNRTDVAVGLGTPGVAVALANASGGFVAPVVHAVPGGAHGLADPADLNGDGRLDLFSIAGDENGPAPGGSVLLGDGAGGFGGALQATSDFVYLPTLADVNGDGRRDLVGISSLGSFGVWLGTGGGTFSAPVAFRERRLLRPGRRRLERRRPAGPRDGRHQRHAQRLLQQLRRRAGQSHRRGGRVRRSRQRGRRAHLHGDGDQPGRDCRYTVFD